MTTPPDPPVAVPGPASGDEPCTRCGATPETGLNDDCGECQGIVEPLPGPASVSPAEPPVLQFIDPPETTYERTGSAKRPDLMGELTALADAFYRVVEYLRTPTPTITESEAAEIADAALFRAEEVIDRGR